MRKALIASVASLAVLGMVGGCLVVAGEGFTTSNKRGTSEVFVPAPQAYVMAVIMFAMSVIAVLWLLQQARLRASHCVIFFAAYLCIAFVLTRALRQIMP